MLRRSQILLWRGGAIAALGVGLIGIALPVLPTTPFLIVAAWAAGKGWPAMEQRLLAHPTYGPHILAWRERGVVPRKAKIFATAMMLASGVGLQLMSVALWLKISVAVLLVAVALWLWSRPDA
jgi:uncharacterized membrane protein YbaN (DUF454 family)